MNTKGIGLGLVISKKIVENFGGMIGFKSKWGKGSNFGFSIQIENELQNTEMIKKIMPNDCEVNLSDTENEN